ncbi:MAG: polysaccharide biosynthesis C-terminal domain-containing protein, partial [Ignavibacteriales bacterium]
IYIEEKSLYIPIITGLSAVISVVSNFVFIPILNITGAALAALTSYLVMAAGYYYVAQKFFQIRYELKRIGHILSAVILVGVLFYYLQSVSKLFFVYKIILLVLFVLYIYFIAVNRNEIRMLRRKFAERFTGKN